MQGITYGKALKALCLYLGNKEEMLYTFLYIMAQNVQCEYSHRSLMMLLDTVQTDAFKQAVRQYHNT